jgi:hypothetical protein
MFPSFPLLNSHLCRLLGSTIGVGIGLAIPFLLTISLFLAPSQAVGQVPMPDEEAVVEEVPDTSGQPGRFRPRGPEKFDLLFNYTFRVGGMAGYDTVPANATSGSVFIGASYNVVLSPIWTIKLQGGLNSYSLNFDQSSKKRFPTTADSLFSEEKIRALYIEFPIALSYVLARDAEQGKRRSFIDLGVTFGYRLQSWYETRRVVGNSGIFSQTDNYPGLAPFRMGAYVKAVYRFVGLYFYWRLTEVFQTNTTFIRRDRSEGTYPKIGPFELGLSIVL